MRLRVWRKVLTLFALALVVGAPSLYADETISIQLTDGLPGPGHTVTITDNGAGDATSTLGVISFIGSVGDWNIDVSIGQGSPFLGPGTLYLDSLNTTSGGTPTTLSILFTQTGNTNPYPGWAMEFGGTSDGIASAVYQAWVDNGNAPFALTTQIGQVGPYSDGGGFSGTDSGSVTVARTYSLTQRIQVTGNGDAGNFFSGGAELTPLPEPTPAVLLAFALAGIGFLGRHGSKLKFDRK